MLDAVFIYYLGGCKMPINSKSLLTEYLIQDAKASNRISIKPKFLGDEIWKFQVNLRKLEYFSYKSTYNKFYIIHKLYCKFKHHRLSIKLGFSIPINTFDKGLSIPHYGHIVVNSKAKVGRNCRIHEGVNIGATNGSDKAPLIGNNVFIASGAKIIGDITIADDVSIGANAVVVKSITEPGTTWGGIPAKKISDNNSHSNLSKLLF